MINRQFFRKYPQVIEPGMAIAIGRPEGGFRVGDVRLENMVIVTEKGAEIIDHMPRDQIRPPKFPF